MIMMENSDMWLWMMKVYLFATMGFAAVFEFLLVADNGL